MKTKKLSIGLRKKKELILKQKNTAKSIALLLIPILMLTLASCNTANNSNNNETEQNSNNQTKTIEIIGSTSVQPIAEILAEKFTNDNPEFIINYQGVGSSKGIVAVKDGTCDIGTSSRELKEEEKNWGLKEYIIAIDGIAIAVHSNNPVKALTKEQAVKIFTGEITNWQEVGGNNSNITLLSREAGSGTRGAFEELLNIQDKVSKNALIFDGNGSMKAAIASNETAIGYLSFGFIDNSIKTLPIDGAEATVENVLNSSYKLSRPFIMLTQNNISNSAKQFLDFVLSDAGQKIIADEGYIPVSK